MKTKNRINTKEPYRIDIHHHVLPKFYLKALEGVGRREMFGLRLPDWSLEAHLQVMDKNKVALGMASIPGPGIYSGDGTFVRDLTRQCNEFLAALQQTHPSRFGTLASLPLPDVDGALAEAKYALDQLKMDGLLMLSNMNGHYVGNPENDELFAELNKRKTVVFIHPGDPPDKGIPESILFPIDTGLETVRAAMSLLYCGVLERYPEVTFIFAHCGGITPFLAYRMVRGRTWVRGEGGADPGLLDDEPDGHRAEKDLGLLQRHYYDTMTANAVHGLETLQAFASASHILFGTDHAILPAKYQPIKIRELRRYKGFDESKRLDVERRNALRLFPRLQEVC